MADPVRIEYSIVALDTIMRHWIKGYEATVTGSDYWIDVAKGTVVIRLFVTGERPTPTLLGEDR